MAIRYSEKCKEEVRNLIEKHGANAIDHVKPCTNLESALLRELRARKLKRIERLK